MTALLGYALMVVGTLVAAVSGCVLWAGYVLCRIDRVLSSSQGAQHLPYGGEKVVRLRR